MNPNPVVRNVDTVQTVNTNFPIINPAHTVYPNPIQPTQPIAKPSFLEERDTRTNQENLNSQKVILPTTKGISTNSIECEVSWKITII